MGHTTGFSKIPRLGYLYSQDGGQDGGGSLATIISSPPTTQILLPQPGDKMSAVATMRPTTALPGAYSQTDREVALSTVSPLFNAAEIKTEVAKAGAKESATNWKSQVESSLANWIENWTASQADGGAGGAVITEEEMMSNLKAIKDKLDKNAAILPEGEMIMDHFSWQPTDDPATLSYGSFKTKENLEKFLSRPGSKSVTTLRHGQTNCNKFATHEHILKQILGRNINYETDQSLLPNVTITNADRTTETRKLTGLEDRYKLISEAALTERGYNQARSMGDLLQSEFPGTDGSGNGDIEHWYISELPRTEETLFAMYGLKPHNHVVGPKAGTVPGTRVTYSSLAALNECPSRHGGNPATHREIFEAISRDSDTRGINRIGVVSHGNTLSGLTDNILNTAPNERYHFHNCQANTTVFSRGLSSREQSVKGMVEKLLKGIGSETNFTANETTAESAAFTEASDKNSDDLLSMMVPVGISAGA